MPVSFKQSISRNLLNIPGWKTKRKIVAIESDDWGTIRVSSKEAYNFFLHKGLPVNTCPYNSYDALESNEDLQFLFETLNSVKDKNSNPAKMTANNIVANPDFEKIKSSNFNQYFYEPFTETLKKYPSHDKVHSLYKEGIANKTFYPQFHGREHINIWRWMKDLQNNDEITHAAFKQNMFSVRIRPKTSYVDEYMDALGSTENLEEQRNILSEGLDLFENLWGFKSKSFIAPAYVWNPSLEETLNNKGVKYIQGVSVQKLPLKESDAKRGKKFHYSGQKNKFGQRYLIRNVFFEPSINPNIDFIDDSMNRITTAFKWNKPVIIGTHRVNFIGFLNPSNRDRNLKTFSTLLSKIKKQWPDVEFMSTDELGDAMTIQN